MLQITTYPSPILKKKAKAVPEITKELLALILHMEEAMYGHEGIGLAAPQVNISQQIMIVHDTEEPHAFFNPEILVKSKEQKVDEEGCLSLPGLFIPIKRASLVTVRCMTTTGEVVEIEAKGLVARIFQHEIDHLQGKLIIDRISPLQRLKIRKKLQQIKNTGRVQS